MKFGKFLEEKSKPEWRLYYVDYKYLKKVIKEMKLAIQNQTQTKKDAELLFTKAIELEINKVNDFFLMIEKEVQGKLSALRQLLNKAVCSFLSFLSFSCWETLYTHFTISFSFFIEKL